MPHTESTHTKAGPAQVRPADWRAANILQWAAATLLCLSVVPLVYFLLKPHIHDSVDPCLLERTYLLLPDSFQPETLERSTFLVSLAVIPIVALVGLPLLGLLIRRMTARGVRYSLGIALLLTSIGGLLLVRQIRSNVLFLDLIFPSTARPGAVSLLPAVVCLAGFLAMFDSAETRRKWRTEWLPLIVGVACGLCFPLVQVLNTRTVDNSYTFTGHFNAVYYSMAQVLGGRGLLVNLSNQYGLYPHFLEPCFRFVGLDVLSFSLTFAALSLFSYLLIVWFLQQEIASRVVASLASLSVLYYGFLSSKLAMPDEPYFQYHPIRTLIPCLCIFLCRQYISRPSRRIYHASFVIYAAGVLWNLDSGLTAWGVWIILLIYHEFATESFTVAAMHGPSTWDTGWRCWQALSQRFRYSRTSVITTGPQSASSSNTHESSMCPGWACFLYPHFIRGS